MVIFSLRFPFNLLSVIFRNSVNSFPVRFNYFQNPETSKFVWVFTYKPIRTINDSPLPQATLETFL